jgi:hypothetical protein
VIPLALGPLANVSSDTTAGGASLPFLPAAFTETFFRSDFFEHYLELLLLPHSPGRPHVTSSLPRLLSQPAPPTHPDFRMAPAHQRTQRFAAPRMRRLLGVPRALSSGIPLDQVLEFTWQKTGDFCFSAALPPPVHTRKRNAAPPPSEPAPPTHRELLTSPRTTVCCSPPKEPLARYSSSTHSCHGSWVQT